MADHPAMETCDGIHHCVVEHAYNVLVKFGSDLLTRSRVASDEGIDTEEGRKLCSLITLTKDP